MDDILPLLEKIGLRRLRAAIRQTPLGRGGREPVIRLETVVKVGTPQALKREHGVYARFARFLKKEERRAFLPNIVFGMVSQKRALLAVEPVGGQTVEEIVLGIPSVAERYGWRSKEVCVRQISITTLAKRVLKKLAVLHRPITVGNPQRELRLFTEELIRGLVESLRRAGIPWDVSLFAHTRQGERGIVSLAHRDLGLSNIMVDEANDVFFIDPRSHVVSASDYRRGARFASPIIDLVAFFVGLTRSELEIRHIRNDFRLAAKRLVRNEIGLMLQCNRVTPLLFRLSEAVIWAGYAACQCTQCRDPKRAWLRQESIVSSMNCLKTLLRLV